MKYNTMKRSFVVLALASAASCFATAPALSAFAAATDPVGMHISGNNPYTISLDAAPTFMIGSTTYDVASIFGVFALNMENNNLNATGSDFSASTGDWK